MLAEALLTLFYAWNITQCVQSSWKRSVVIHHHFKSISTLTIKHSVFSVIAGLLIKMLFFVYNGLKMSEYKAYWLMDFLLINNWVRVKKE